MSQRANFPGSLISTLNSLFQVALYQHTLDLLGPTRREPKAVQGVGCRLHGLEFMVRFRV